MATKKKRPKFKVNIYGILLFFPRNFIKNKNFSGNNSLLDTIFIM